MREGRTVKTQVSSEEGPHQESPTGDNRRVGCWRSNISITNASNEITNVLELKNL